MDITCSIFDADTDARKGFVYFLTCSLFAEEEKLGFFFFFLSLLSSSGNSFIMVQFCKVFCLKMLFTVQNGLKLKA